MAFEAQWKTLPLERADRRPTLLVSTRFTTSSYAVHVSDLTNIWSECLDRRAIILRALNENTCIDPSDGDENMKSFLRCLEASLDAAEPDHGLTTLSLAKGMTNQAEADAGRATDGSGLILKVTCELPRELSATPLAWNMYLEMGPPSAMTTELILPLVEAHRAERSRTESLVDVIQQKDAVITKLVDKLDATGIPLENIFTSLSTKRKVMREQANTRVKGLGPFDREKWNAEVTAEGEATDIPSLLNSVFASGVAYNPSMASSQKFEAWWEDTDSSEAIQRTRDSRSIKSLDISSARKSEDGRGNKLGTAKSGSEDDANNGDDGGLESVPVRSRFGKIGGKAKMAEEIVPSKRPPTIDDGSATASEDDDGDSIAVTSEKKDPPSSPGGKASTGLTSLRARGGRARQAAPRSLTRSPTPPGKEAGEETLTKAASPKGQAGGIGGIGIIGGGTKKKQPKPVEEAGDSNDAINGDEESARQTLSRPAKGRHEEKKPLARPVKKKRKF